MPQLRALLLLMLVAAAPPLAAKQRFSAIAPVPEPPPQAQDRGSEVEIKTKDGQALRASYFGPRKSTQLSPGAILVHDTGADRAQLLELADRLHKTGFAVVVLDMRGHGLSASRDLVWTKLDEAARHTAWALAVRDLEAASAWIRDRKEVHGTNLTVAGYRAGCALAARFALRDENVRSVVLVEPRPEELGINVRGDLTELGGLPTYLVSRKEDSAAAEAMIQEAHQASGGHPYIELMVCSAKKEEEPAIERKVVASIAKWAKEKAFPHK